MFTDALRSTCRVTSDNSAPDLDPTGPDAAAVASPVDQAKGQARLCRPPPLHFFPALAPLGATENARHEFAALVCTGGNCRT